MDLQTLQKLQKQMEAALGGPGTCTHPNSKRWDDTNKDGTIVMLHCPDCGQTCGVHPDQIAAWEKSSPV